MLKKGLILLFVLIFFCGVLPISARDIDESIPYDARIWVDNQLVENLAGYLTQKGNMLVPAQIVERMGASFQWNPEEWMIRITSENRSLVMYVNNFQCANGTKVEKMPAHPIVFQGTVMIPLRYVAENLGAAVLWSGKDIYVSTTGELPVVEQQNPDSQKTNPNEALQMKKTIVLDPGHGGSDPGAVAGKVQEKELNLQVAKILKGMLDEVGMTVYMTRSEDKYVGLYTRADIANHLKADLFVSIHHNASPNTAAQGLMTLYYPTSSSNQKMNGQKLAQIVQKNLVKELKTRDWGIIARPNLVVTRETKMPAVIAELGFITNKTELERLVTYQFQRQAAQALYASILEALTQ